MTDLLAGAKAKVIGNTVFFSEAQVDPGYVYITQLIELTAKSETQSPAVVALLEIQVDIQL